MSEPEVGLSIQEILTGPMGLSRRLIQKLTRAKGVRVNGRPAFLKRKVRAGDVVAARIGYEEDAGLAPIPMELAIVHEDDHLLVIDKPAGLLVHPVGRGGQPTLAHGITHHLLQSGTRTRVRPVHRLDRDTSGLLIVAKSGFAHQALDQQLRSRELSRGYLALAQGSPDWDEQAIDAPIGRHPHDPSLRAVVPNGDRAVTHIWVVERFQRAVLIRVELETGRTHQIRVHLAHLGHPLLGDTQYGAVHGGAGRQALHAARLAFRHPVSGEAIELTSDLPADLEALRRKLTGRRDDHAQG